MALRARENVTTGDRRQETEIRRYSVANIYVIPAKAWIYWIYQKKTRGRWLNVQQGLVTIAGK